MKCALPRKRIKRGSLAVGGFKDSNTSKDAIAYWEVQNMKRMLICLAALILSFFSFSSCNAADEIDKWSACGPWSGGGNLAIDPLTPSTLYVTAGGVFKSTNGGANWAAMNNGLGDLNVITIAIDPITPSKLYAGTGRGVYTFIASANEDEGGGNHNGSSGSRCFISAASQ